MKCTHTLVVLCCCLAILAACKKSDNNKTTNNGNNNTTPPTVRQLLLAGKWQEIARTGTVNYMGKDSTIDIYATMEDCEKDDYEIYLDDGSVVINENTNVCPGNSQTSSATWVLLNNDTKLALIDNNPDTADILELTTAQMKIKLSGINTSGKPVTETYTFKNIK